MPAWERGIQGWQNWVEVVEVCTVRHTSLLFLRSCPLPWTLSYSCAWGSDGDSGVPPSVANT